VPASPFHPFECLRQLTRGDHGGVGHALRSPVRVVGREIVAHRAPTVAVGLH
jgi:hypothetical protein